MRVGCPIRKSTDQCLLAAPHGLSQRAASFIASQRQGIHQMPFRRLISFSHLSAMRRSKPAHDSLEDTSDRTSSAVVLIPQRLREETALTDDIRLMLAVPLRSSGSAFVTSTFRSSSVTKPSSLVKDPCGTKGRNPGHEMTQPLKADVNFVYIVQMTCP